VTATPFVSSYLGCHCDISGATSVLPAPVRFLEEDVLELLPDLELEPHAASPSDAATARSAVLVRMSFVCIGRILARLHSAGVSEP
jgi:hypothetical protein